MNRTKQMSRNPGYQGHNHLSSHLVETTWPASSDKTAQVAAHEIKPHSYSCKLSTDLCRCSPWNTSQAHICAAVALSYGATLLQVSSRRKQLLATGLYLHCIESVRYSMSQGHKACTKALAASPPSLQTAAVQITKVRSGSIQAAEAFPCGF